MNETKRKLIEYFFAHFPVFHAIPRVNEALALEDINLDSPVLDLGCGDGEFALLTFGQKGIDVGLDLREEEVTKARKSGAYKKVVVADARRMPFDDGEFRAVIANSVLEHVENLDQTLNETVRVLKKGGKLILTVPTPLVCQYQFWAEFIPGYARFKKKIWRHINYFDEEEWHQRLLEAGFKIVSVKKINSKAAISWADIFFPLWWLGPMKWVVPFLEKRKVFGFDEKGATLVMVAER